MSIRSSFNRAANLYDSHCNLQQKVGDALIAKLHQYCLQADSILDMGCGTGLITEKLVEAYQTQHFHALDIAEALLAKAKKRLAPTVCFHHASFDELNGFRNQVDLIFSNMALHWSKDLNAAINAMKTLLNLPGYLAFSIPTFGTFTELKPPLAKMHFYAGETINSILQNNDYEILLSQEEEHILHFPDTLSALHSIKQVGANHVADPSKQGLRGKHFLQKITCRTLTYNISYFIARKNT